MAAALDRPGGFTWLNPKIGWRLHVALPGLSDGRGSGQRRHAW